MAALDFPQPPLTVGQPYTDSPGTGLPPLAPESGAIVMGRAPTPIAAVATFAAFTTGGGLAV